VEKRRAPVIDFLKSLRFPANLTLGIGCSAKRDAFNPCVRMPGSNGSAINQAGISFPISCGCWPLQSQERARERRERLARAPILILIIGPMIRTKTRRWGWGGPEIRGMPVQDGPDLSVTETRPEDYRENPPEPPGYTQGD
jgi:hypothetical protein